MIGTRVGYAGGKKENPTYTELGDHTEAFEVEYDPEQISYRDLLEIFWSEHDPGRESISRQYMSAVFARDEEQERIAMDSRRRVEAERGRSVITPVLPVESFTPAEDYHQKYYLKREKGLLGEYREIYPEHRDFVRSTAVAKVNGFLGGNGTLEELEADIGGLGLSSSGNRRLREYVRSTPRRRACAVPSRKAP